MEKRDEWLIDFQVKNGRKPTVQEMAEAAKSDFAIETSTSSIKPAKRGFGKVQLTWFTLLEVLLLLCIAVFGYVVGYLFL